jgi:hypothetical protein
MTLSSCCSCARGAGGGWGWGEGWRVVAGWERRADGAARSMALAHPRHPPASPTHVTSPSAAWGGTVDEYFTGHMANGKRVTRDARDATRHVIAGLAQAIAGGLGGGGGGGGRDRQPQARRGQPGPAPGRRARSGVRGLGGAPRRQAAERGAAEQPCLHRRRCPLLVLHEALPALGPPRPAPTPPNPQAWCPPTRAPSRRATARRARHPRRTGAGRSARRRLGPTPPTQVGGCWGGGVRRLGLGVRAAPSCASVRIRPKACFENLTVFEKNLSKIYPQLWSHANRP